jgi:hypothetical protein
MNCEDLLCRDLLSEIVLVGFGTLIVISLLLFLMAVFAHA